MGRKGKWGEGNNLNMRYKTEEYNKWYREYRKKNAAHKRAIVRKSSARPEYVESRKRYMEVWLKNNHDKVLANRRKHRIKWRARWMFKYYVKTGKIKRMPCEFCGNPKSQGHHTDYSKPTQVIWLCRKHHSAAHRKESILANH